MRNLKNWLLVLVIVCGVCASALAQQNVLQSGHNGFDRGWISAVQFSPDGRWLASAIGGDFASGGQVLIWNAQKRIWAREDSLPPVQSLDWSADNLFLAIGDDRGAKIWSREQKKIVAATTWDDNDTDNFDGVSRIKFLGGNRVAVLQGEPSDKSKIGKKSYATLRIWNWKNGAQTVLKTLNFYTRDMALHVSPNRETLAISNVDGVELFSAANGKSQVIQQQVVLPKTEKSGLFFPRNLVFSPDSKLVAGFQHLSSTYAVFDVKTSALKNIGQIAGSVRPRDFAIDNEGQIVWMLRPENNLSYAHYLERFQSGKIISSVKQEMMYADLDEGDANYARSQQFIVAGNMVTDGALFWFDAATLSLVHVSRPAKQWANTVAFSNDGVRFAVGYGADNSSGTTAELAVFNARNGLLARDAIADSGIDSFSSGINDVVFTPDGKYLLTTCDIDYDKTEIRVLDAKSLRLLRDVALPGGSISKMAFSRDGKNFVIGTHDNKVLFWKDFRRALAAQKPDWIYQPREKSPEDALVYALEIAPDGKSVLATFNHGPTALLNAQNGALLHHRNDGITVGGAVFSANGQTFWTGNDKGEIKQWNAKIYRLHRVIQKSGDSCEAMELSHDQQHLYVALGRNIVAFNAKTGVQERVFDSAPQQINSLAVAPDGKTLVSADEFGTARIYDTKTGKCTHIFHRTSWNRDKKGALTTRTATQMPNGKIVFSPGNHNAILKRDGDLMKSLP